MQMVQPSVLMESVLVALIQIGMLKALSVPIVILDQLVVAKVARNPRILLDRTAINCC